MIRSARLSLGKFARKWIPAYNELRLSAGYLRTSGWSRSMRVGRSFANGGKAIPWMSYSIIEFLEQQLPSGVRVLEWGSGQSTIWWSGRASEVIAIEHDAGWVGVVAPSVGPNVRVLFADVRSAEYLTKPLEFGAFDVVVVDGRRRSECVGAAEGLVNESGIIIVDDAARPEYAAAIGRLVDNGWTRLDFGGMRPLSYVSGLTAMLYRSRTSVVGL